MVNISQAIWDMEAQEALQPSYRSPSERWELTKQGDEGEERDQPDRNGDIAQDSHSCSNCMVMSIYLGMGWGEVQPGLAVGPAG
jgi:hypothetical protein